MTCFHDPLRTIVTTTLNLTGIVALVFLFFIVCSHQSVKTQEVQMGLVHGKITIGPTRPVERSGMPPPDMTRWYRGKIILIYSEDEKKLVATAPVDDSGNYRVSVAPGNYVLKMKLKGIQRAGNLPKEIVVNAGETVQIDVDIDTGIR